MSSIESQMKEGILHILGLSFLPLTKSDIFDFLKEIFFEKKLPEPNRSTFNKSITSLEDQEVILKKRIEGKRDIYYSTVNRDIDDNELEIIVIAKPVVFHSTLTTEEVPDDLKDIVTSDLIKEEGDSSEEDVIKKPESKELLQCVGLINYYDVRKFCGLYHYIPEKHEEFSVQRPMILPWVRKLRKFFSQPDSTMLTPAIVYFDKKKIKIETLYELFDVKILKLTIKIEDVAFDKKKAGWILDGQQRMWATDFNAISAGKERYDLVAPISMALGDFDDADEEEMKLRMQIIRKIFIISNQTQNVRGAWLKSLASHMSQEKMPGISMDLSIDATYQNYAKLLNQHKDSPFKSRIDESELKKVTKDGEFISLGNMSEIIKVMIENSKGHLVKGYLDRDSLEFKENLSKIKDYFNTISCIWEVAWGKDYKDNRIRSTVVLYAFVYFYEHFISIDSSDLDRKSFIKNTLIRTLLKIKQNTSFMAKDSLVEGKKNNKKTGKEMSDAFYTLVKSSAAEITNTEIEGIYNKVLKKYPSGSPSEIF